MTATEKKIHSSLLQCSPNHFKDEAFIQQLTKWTDRPLTQKGHDHMLRLMNKYRKQIPDWLELRAAMTDEQIDNRGI